MRRVFIAALLGAVATGCATGGASPAGAPSAGEGTLPGVGAPPSPTVRPEGNGPPQVVRPGAPGEASRHLPASEAGPASLPGHAEADVHFMRMMIVHHAQAVEMTALVPDRTEREDILLLARRIEAAQTDEMAWMERWLELRGESPAPEAHDPHHHHGHHGHLHQEHGVPPEDPHAGMPGMLTREELDRLARARGPEFDRLFLESMIFHHEGAIIMVHELFSSPHGGQEGETYEFASHVESDQRMEIDRMRRMLLQGS